ncbi:hypothetical protein FOZ61_006978 [Perkinsus olseni]|uniref:N-acetyltransferase domain-containing protein n=1 Tax=Perkinsus olseni TaxID=32597 RepID=A0A7J6M9X0_PEROL|nr:hypothetical protein FOZ61_006978 [Perkinsus olseni]
MTNNATEVVGFLHYSLMTGDGASGMHKFLKIPKKKRNGDIGYISDVQVLPSSQNQGVGTRMVSEWLKHMREKWPKIVAAYLLVKPGNVNAKKAYENVGFTELMSEHCLRPLVADQSLRFWWRYLPL